jgi:BASS family bile acid:Na+ symporter
MHNAVLAMGIALSPQLLNNPEMAIPAAVYGLIALFIALAFIFTVRRLDPAFRAPDGRRDLPIEGPAPFKDPQEDPA